MGPQSSRRPDDLALFDGAYELLAAVGRGRNSVVYQARKLPIAKFHLAGSDIVALKVLVENPKHADFNIKRIRRESLALLACRHPNIIRLCDFVASDSACYLAMEYAEGGDLLALLESRGGPLPFEFSVSLITEVLRGVEAIHRAGIIHRDLKPENILLTKEHRVKITDFGVAYLPVEKVPADDASLTVGTLDYLAPECLEHSTIDTRSDLYSVAVTFYQLLTNRMPFASPALAEEIGKKLSGKFHPLPEIENTERQQLLSSFFRIALAPEASTRFQTAAEFREAMEELLAGTWNAEREETKRAVNSVATVANSPRSPNGRKNGGHAKKTIRLATELPTLDEHVLDEEDDGSGMAKIARPSNLARSYFEKMRTNKLFWIAPAILLFVAIGLVTSFSDGPESEVVLSKDLETLSPNAPDELSSPALTEQELEQATAQVSANIPANPTFSGERVGVLEGLFIDGTDVPFVLSMRSNQEGSLALGLFGFEPKAVNPEAFLRGEVFSIAGSGLALTLQASVEGPSNNEGLRGVYHDLSTGREGRWRLW